jgi:hypothetical protein
MNAILDHPNIGTLQGVDNGRGVNSFLGVPYAALSKRWTYATPLDRLGSDPFNATIHGRVLSLVAREL